MKTYVVLLSNGTEMEIRALRHFEEDGCLILYDKGSRFIESQVAKFKPGSWSGWYIVEE